ncbi:MAG: ankyrin repeat domain-containing protein [Thermoanaerobaculia bacterium]
MWERITNGRTDLVFDHVMEGRPATAVGPDGVPLIQWCAYFGDVSALRYLLSNGESLTTLGEHALGDAAFHGHWRLAEFLIESGADVNAALPATGETPLHAALCTADRPARDLVLRVLLANGADPNRTTTPGAKTGGFMRDARTRGETPLHRAAAFGTEESIRMLVEAGADLAAKDVNGDSPLSWASWYERPAAILRMLCFGEFQIHPERKNLRTYLLGEPARE